MEKIEVVPYTRELEREYGSILNAPADKVRILQGFASERFFKAIEANGKYVSTASTTKDIRWTTQRKKAYHALEDDDFILNQALKTEPTSHYDWI